jgi:hypothetical protein
MHHFRRDGIVRAMMMHLHVSACVSAGSSSTPVQGDRVHTNLEAYWEHVRHPMFVAFFELAVAARTDSELAAILRPAQEAFEEELHSTAREVFTEWRTNDVNFDMALDLTRYVLEGMAISFLVHKENERDRRVRAYLEEKLRELRDSRA